MISKLTTAEWREQCELFLTRQSLEVFHRIIEEPGSLDSRLAAGILSGLCEELALCAEQREINSQPLQDLILPLTVYQKHGDPEQITQIRARLPSAIQLVERLQNRLLAVETWSSLDAEGRKKLIFREALETPERTVLGLARHVATMCGTGDGTVRSWINRHLLEELHQLFLTLR